MLKRAAPFETTLFHRCRTATFIRVGWRVRYGLITRAQPS